MCFTGLTINNLLENSNCSMHESNGSFMSIQNSNDSDYNGVLCGMGRSIDIQNISSNKKVQDYPLTKLNKSINYWRNKSKNQKKDNLYIYYDYKLWFINYYSQKNNMDNAKLLLMQYIVKLLSPSSFAYGNIVAF